MIVVLLCLANGLHVTIAAWQADRSRLQHVHPAIYDLANGPAEGIAVRTRPSWPSFRRRALGQSCEAQRACFMGGDASIEMCEINNPEIRPPMGLNTDAASFTKGQVALFRRLWSERQEPPDDRKAKGLARILDDPLPRCLLPPATTRLASFFSSSIETFMKAGRKNKNKETSDISTRRIRRVSPFLPRAPSWLPTVTRSA